MNTSPKLQLQQSQSLHLSQQMLQAIKLLQLNNLELQTYVTNELEKNPLLELSDLRELKNKRAEKNTEHDEKDWFHKSLDQNANSIATELDTHVQDLFPDQSQTGAVPARNEQGSHTDSWLGMGQATTSDAWRELDFESNLRSEPTLREYLSQQMSSEISDPVERIIGQHLIDMINEVGYLVGSCEGAAQRLDVPVDKVEAVLEKLQQLDPPGVAARDLKECLAIQLKLKDRLDPAMDTLLQHLELWAKKDFLALRKLCEVDKEDFTDMLAEIKALNPKPGNAFGAFALQPVVADVVIKRGRDGAWEVELNSDTLPRVLINQRYLARVYKSELGKKDRLYLNDCLRSANWLVKSMDQRARTILNVAREIVKHQDGFLNLGVQFMKPLNLKMVADEVGVHESTVSRVISNKFVETPRGTLEMKFFFSNAVGDGSDIAAEAVRDKIRQLIEAETADNILSDDALVSLLKKEGIEVARRTVAKYRTALNIPTSAVRKREQRAGI